MMPVISGSFKKLTYENAKEIGRKAAGVRGVAPVCSRRGLCPLRGSATRYNGDRRDPGV